jgi:steroid 5-alpha reductase family enzyme
MPPLASTFIISIAALIGLMTLLWLVSVALRDASIVDPFWGAGFAVVAAIACARHQPLTSRALIIATLTTIWGLRLSVHLLRRNLGHGEDRRYAAMRAKSPDRFWWTSYFVVFLLQALILGFVSMPIQATIAAAPSGLHMLDVLGGGIWLVGLVFEAVSDAQLAKFQSDETNRGRVLDRGLWRWSRHPNYFGDFCVWWGFYLIGAGAGAWWTIGSPILMSIFLMRVSGVGLLEKTITHRRPEYAGYIERTNAFFPWMPKRAR